jgi:hypothetical protein
MRPPQSTLIHTPLGGPNQHAITAGARNDRSEHQS